MTRPPHPPEQALPWRIPLLSGQQLDVETQSRAVCCSGFPLGTISPRSLFSLDPFKTVLPRAAGGVKALCRDTDVTDEVWFSSKTKSFVLKPCWTTAVSPLACQLWTAENTVRTPWLPAKGTLRWRPFPTSQRGGRPAPTHNG